MEFSFASKENTILHTGSAAILVRIDGKVVSVGGSMV